MTSTLFNHKLHGDYFDWRILLSYSKLSYVKSYHGCQAVLFPFVVVLAVFGYAYYCVRPVRTFCYVSVTSRNSGGRQTQEPLFWGSRAEKFGNPWAKVLWCCCRNLNQAQRCLELLIPKNRWLWLLLTLRCSWSIITLCGFTSLCIIPMLWQ